MEWKGEIYSSTITFGGFNILLSIMDRTTRKKVNNQVEDLTNTTHQLDLADI